MWKRGNQRQCDDWQERENGNALEDIKNRHHDGTGTSASSRNMSIDQRKYQREHIAQHHTQQRVAGVQRQCCRREVDREGRVQRCRPTGCSRDQKGRCGKQCQHDQQINTAIASCDIFTASCIISYFLFRDSPLKLLTLAGIVGNENLSHRVPPCILKDWAASWHRPAKNRQKKLQIAFWECTHFLKTTILWGLYIRRASPVKRTNHVTYFVLALLNLSVVH